MQNCLDKHPSSLRKHPPGHSQRIILNIWVRLRRVKHITMRSAWRVPQSDTKTTGKIMDKHCSSHCLSLSSPPHSDLRNEPSFVGTHSVPLCADLALYQALLTNNGDTPSSSIYSGVISRSSQCQIVLLKIQHCKDLVAFEICAFGKSYII